MKRQKSEQPELTNNPNDRDPFRKKQQMAVSNGLFKPKSDLRLGLHHANNVATELAIRVANAEAKKLHRNIRIKRRRQ